MYVDPAKVTGEVAEHLREAGVDTKPYCLGQVKQVRRLSARVSSPNRLRSRLEWSVNSCLTGCRRRSMALTVAVALVV